MTDKKYSDNTKLGASFIGVLSMVATGLAVAFGGPKVIFGICLITVPIFSAVYQMAKSPKWGDE